MSFFRAAVLFALPALMLAACSDPEPEGGSPDPFAGMAAAKIENDLDAERWASSSSAPNVYMQVLMPLVLVQNPIEGDPDCPKQTQSEGGTTFEGGCTDKNGNQWVGKAVMTGAMGQSEVKVSYQGLGFTSTEDCNGTPASGTLTFNGSVTLGQSESSQTFSASLNIRGEGVVDETCEAKAETFAYSYNGTRVDESNERQIWNGRGRLGSDTTGRADVETKDEVLDSSNCGSQEALSGTTTITGANTLVITYDGATDCDEDSTVQWSLDGTAKGELIGVSCASSGASSSFAWIVIGAALAFATRSRRTA